MGAARDLTGAPRFAAYAAGQAAECLWQRSRLPDAVRELVPEDQRRRNSICWDVFSA